MSGKAGRRMAAHHEARDAGRNGSGDAGPSLVGALRAAAGDFFYNSWRVVPLNVLWGVLFLVALGLAILVHPLAAVPVLVPTAIPLAGLARFGGRATRGMGIDFGAAWEPIRARPRAVLVAGLAFVLAVALFTLNLLAGFALGHALGWAFATAAAWGLLTTIGLGYAFWPLLTDPQRDTAGSMAIARLAGLLVLAHPFRIAGLTVVLTALLAVSTVAFAALVSVSVGFAMLVAARYVLPAADRLEARLVALDRLEPLRVEPEEDEA
jgi:hypothetical protein